MQTIQQFTSWFSKQKLSGKVAVGCSTLFFLCCLCSIPISILNPATQTPGVVNTFATEVPSTLVPTQTEKPTEIPTNTSTPTDTPNPTTITLPTSTQTASGPVNPVFSGDTVDPPWWPCAKGQLKGNRNSGIYHAPDQRDYAKTYDNVECFNTAAEAKSAGYRAAKR